MASVKRQERHQRDPRVGARPHDEDADVQPTARDARAEHAVAGGSEQPSGAVARDHHAQHDRIAEHLACQDRQHDRCEGPDQQHGDRREDDQRAKRGVAPDERDRLAQPDVLLPTLGDGAGSGEVDEPRDDERSERRTRPPSPTAPRRRRSPR